LRARDFESSSAEIYGPPTAFLGLTEVIAALCKTVPCIAHDIQAEAGQQAVS